jgi:hypothetical protein
MWRSMCLGFALALGTAQAAVGQQRLHVQNTMTEGIYFWIKSEVRPDTEWQRHFIRKNDTFSIRLVSPDCFQIVVEDPQGRKFSAGLFPLKAMLEGNPSQVLKLEGIFATQAAAYMEWSPSRRAWILRPRNKSERVGVTFNFRVNDELSYEPITAHRIE